MSDPLEPALTIQGLEVRLVGSGAHRSIHPRVTLGCQELGGHCPRVYTVQL